MSNYFPLTLNQWKIQKRPPDLQPDLSDSSKNQKRRSLAIHSLSVSAQKKVLRKSNDFRKHKSTLLKEQKFQMRSSGGFKPYKKNPKAQRKLDRDQNKESVTKTVSKFYKTMQQKRKQKELKGYILFRNKDLKSINQSRLIAKKIQNLSDLLLVRPAQYFYNAVQTKDEQIHYFDEKQEQQEQFSPYYRRKRVQTERQVIKNNPLNTTDETTDKKQNKEVQQANNHNKSKMQFQGKGEKDEKEDQNIFLSAKEMSLQKRTNRRMQMSAKCRYINYNQTMMEEHKKKSNERLNRIRTQHLPITPWDTRQKL